MRGLSPNQVWRAIKMWRNGKHLAGQKVASQLTHWRGSQTSGGSILSPAADKFRSKLGNFREVLILLLN